MKKTCTVLCWGFLNIDLLTFHDVFVKEGQQVEDGAAQEMLLCLAVCLVAFVTMSVQPGASTHDLLPCSTLFYRQQLNIMPWAMSASRISSQASCYFTVPGSHWPQVHMSLEDSCRVLFLHSWSSRPLTTLFYLFYLDMILRWCLFFELWRNNFLKNLKGGGK